MASNFPNVQPIQLTQSLNLRTEPNGNAIRSFGSDYLVQPLAKSKNGWIYVTINHEGGAVYGWMSEEYLTNLESNTNLPLIDAEEVSQREFDSNSPYNPHP